MGTADKPRLANFLECPEGVECGLSASGRRPVKQTFVQLRRDAAVRPILAIGLSTWRPRKLPSVQLGKGLAGTTGFGG